MASGLNPANSTMRPQQEKLKTVQQEKLKTVQGKGGRLSSLSFPLQRTFLMAVFERESKSSFQPTRMFVRFNNHIT